MGYRTANTCLIPAKTIVPETTPADPTPYQEPEPAPPRGDPEAAAMDHAETRAAGSKFWIPYTITSGQTEYAWETGLSSHGRNAARGSA